MLADLALKNSENEQLTNQLQEAQNKFQTIKQWIDELKDKFFAELQVVATIMLNCRLKMQCCTTDFQF